MVRETQEILKMQLGSLLIEVAVLTSALEKAQEEVARLKAVVADTKKDLEGTDGPG